MSDNNFDSGAVRSADTNHLDFASIPLVGLIGVARTAAEGGAKYGRMNYMLGLPVHDLLNHAISHIVKFLLGSRDEPELEHAAWNVLAAIQSLALDPELSRPHLLGPGATVTPEMKDHLESGAADRKARRQRGEFDRSGHWTLEQVPEVAKILKDRGCEPAIREAIREVFGRREGLLPVHMAEVFENLVRMGAIRREDLEAIKKSLLGDPASRLQARSEAIAAADEAHEPGEGVISRPIKDARKPLTIRGEEGVPASSPVSMARALDGLLASQEKALLPSLSVSYSLDEESGRVDLTDVVVRDATPAPKPRRGRKPKGREIPITGKHGEGRSILVDAADYPALSALSIYLHKNGQVKAYRDGSLQTVAAILYGKDGLTQTVHENGDPLDFRRSNLKRIPRGGRTRGGDSPGKPSNYRGVNFHKRVGKWIVKFRDGGVRLNLGYLDDELKAAKLYDFYAHRLLAQPRPNFAQIDYADYIYPAATDTPLEVNGVYYLSADTADGNTRSFSAPTPEGALAAREAFVANKIQLPHAAKAIKKFRRLAKAAGK